MTAEDIRIRGVVQGVGFRPFIWTLAARFGIAGDVRNDGEGVLIRAWGEQLDAFIAAIREQAPRLARISAIERRAIAPEDAAAPSGFTILGSEAGIRDTGVTPDAAICPACRAEIADPAARRHGYAFTNCTDCGPRFSIIEAIPYDRATTTMRGFLMCPACRAEYDTPADRRFHAQPIACPDCGPSLTFLAPKESCQKWPSGFGKKLCDNRGISADMRWRSPACPPSGAATEPEPEADAPLEAAARLILGGGILALKGLGGFHLACDATNETACAALRQRKCRPAKPFALMAPSLAMVRAYSRPTEAEERLLADPAAPIVLIEGKGEGDGKGTMLAPSVAPSLDMLGWMLPHTPLHVLLCARVGRPLVMTSGNLSGEPQVIGNDEALEKLSTFADGFLMHDRDIARRLDDSVAAIVAGAPRILRRGRGLAPAPIALPPSMAHAPPVLALGGELKSAICFTAGGRALLSHHMGDLDDALSHDEFERAIADYEMLFGAAPEVIACDSHPGYRATAKAREIAGARGLPLIAVQHHHAHIASAMADNGWRLDGGPVLGVALDGTGHGTDGTVWGGEWLLCHYGAFQRVGALRPVRLPGGDAAAREPWRNLLAQLTAAFGEEEAAARIAAAGLSARFALRPVAPVAAMIRGGLNAPLTSSAGRLFDAVAAAIGCCFDRVSFEGQAAMEAESLARRAGNGSAGYPFARVEAEGVNGSGIGGADDMIWLDPAPMWDALLADLARGAAPWIIAARFHRGFGEAASSLALDLARRHGAAAIALSGGVMQNGLLLQRMLAILDGGGRPVLTQRQAPTNDGGLALGQAVAAAAMAREA